jgi:ubiquinone/menaquinone biosynthesis C-methylase UbiE
LSLSAVANFLFYFLVHICAYLKALDEAYRVLAPGGRFMCLEFSAVTNPVLERYKQSASYLEQELDSKK